VNDELAGGPARRRRVRAPVPRGWVRAGGVLAVVAVVGFGGWQASHAGHGHLPSPAPTAEPSPTAPPNGVKAPRLTGRTGLHLLVTGQRLTELDVDRRQTREVTGMWRAASALFEAAGGTVVVGFDIGGDCEACGLYFLPRGAYTARLIGRYDGAVPAAVPGLLWAFRYAAGRTPGTVVELDLAGREHSPQYPLPAGRFIRRGTVAGLVSYREGGSTFTELWDPRTGRVDWGFPGTFVAAGPTQLVTSNGGCTRTCALDWTDLVTRRTREITVPGQPVAGALDSGSRVLAVAASVLERDGTPVVDTYLVRGSEVTLVRSATVYGGPPGYCWSGSRLVVWYLAPGGAGPLSLGTATIADPQLRRLDRLDGTSVVAR
jgi:hypothetical protein